LKEKAIFLIFSQSQDKEGVSALNFSKLKDDGFISEFLVHLSSRQGEIE